MYATAKAAAALTGRTVAEQLSHWAKVGSEVEASTDIAADKHAAGRPVIHPRRGRQRRAAHANSDALAHAYDAVAEAAAVRERYIAGRRSFITETVFSHASKIDL